VRPQNERPSTDASQGPDIDVSDATLFTLVWDTMAEVLGTAAVAAIVRRAVENAAVECPELVDLVVRREKLGYGYALPHAWSKTTQTAALGRGALRVLVAEVGRILVELTGIVVITRLDNVPELRNRGLVWRTEDPK